MAQLESLRNDLTKIASNKVALINFLGSPTAAKLQKAQPQLISALHSIISFTGNGLYETDKPAYEIMRKMLGKHIDHIQSAEGLPHAKKIMILKGGSFWSNIGHWFSHAANTVGHAFKNAGEAVYNKVLKPAGEAIYHGLKDASEWVYDHRKVISKAINIATQILSVLPIPYVQEVALELKPFVNIANTAIQASGLAKRIGLANKLYKKK